MCGGWACASFDLACNNPPLSTIRYTGRNFVRTPCGPFDKCFAKDVGGTRVNCSRPCGATIEMNPCLDLTKTSSSNVAPNRWQSVYLKIRSCPGKPTGEDKMVQKD